MALLQSSPCYGCPYHQKESPTISRAVGRGLVDDLATSPVWFFSSSSTISEAITGSRKRLLAEGIRSKYPPGALCRLSQWWQSDWIDLHSSTLRENTRLNLRGYVYNCGILSTVIYQNGVTYKTRRSVVILLPAYIYVAAK